MAGSVAIAPPKLDLNFTNSDTQHDLPSLVKEASTVGDLISFTERPQPVTSDKPTLRRRSSVGDAPVFGRRRGSLIRSESTGNVFGNRLKSLSPTKNFYNDDKNLRNRLKSISPTKNFYNNDDNRSDDTASPPKGRMSRRDSMMNMLREELQQVPCLQALRKHSIQRMESEDNEVFELSLPNHTKDSESEDESSSSNKISRFSRRSSRVSYGRESRRSTADNVTLTEAEMRKLQMLHTLNKMGDQTARPNMDRKMSITGSQTGEVAILEASYGARGKRGSITTRLLLKANNTRPREVKMPMSDRSDLRHSLRRRFSSTGSDGDKTQEMTEIQKEKQMKVLNILKGPTAPKLLPAIGGNQETPNLEGAIKESFKWFRKKVRRKKLRPVEVFRRRAKFVVLLLRAWKIHSNAINESLIVNNDSLDMITRGGEANLMFDITTFKAVKEAKVSQEARRILMKKPSTRTEDEKHYIQVFLRNYKSIAEYPVKMQKMIAERSWYESYDIKRVIVREGHVPMCFYFLLSGSALVSTMEKGSAKTVMFLHRGDSFGDVAILNKSRRETTVISREKIELLVMSDSDFTDIFMSGGIRDPDDPFLKSIHFLNGWPREKLIENPKKCIFSYFKRGTVLVADSLANDWIFVIKSGSASVLKKLHTVDARKRPKYKKPKDLRDDVLEHMRHEAYLSHEEQVAMMCEEEKRSLDDQNLHVRFYALPEINVKTNELYNELRQMKEEYINANTMNRVLGSLEKMADAGMDVKSEVANSDSTVAASKKTNRRMSLTNALLKGPFMQKSVSGIARENSNLSASSRNSRRSSHVTGGHRASIDESYIQQQQQQQQQRQQHHQDMVDNIKKVDDWQGMALPSVAESPINDLRARKAEPKPVFVEIQALTKGQIFGVSEMLFDNQPLLSLVSNGTECIMIEKKFFQEYASQGLMVRLREQTFPYPSDDALQVNLEDQLRWDHHREQVLSCGIRDVQIRKSDKNDARSLLQIKTACELKT